MVEDSKILYLDIGGRKFSTSLGTLLKYPTSMLGLMFSGRVPSTKDKDGNYFIDADGDMFVYILNFLRRNQLCLPEDFCEYERLLLEVEFFQIEPLVDIVRNLKQKRETVLLCMLTGGTTGSMYSGDIDSTLCIAHFQSHNSFQTNHLPTEYAVYKNFLQTQGYSILNRAEKIECTGEWLLSMLSQGFLTNPVTPYERNVVGRFDSYEVWCR